MNMQIIDDMNMSINVNIDNQNKSLEGEIYKGQESV